MKKNNLFFLTLSAVFIAIIAVMTLTPIGYLKLGPVIEITLMAIPVAFGGTLLGKWGGLLLGTAFGVSSFVQCFGASTFGVALLSISPVKTFLVCMLPRMALGFFSAWIFEAMSKKVNSALSGIVSFLSAAIINTVGFVGLLAAFFYKTEYIQTIAQQIGATNVFMFAVLFAGTNALIEAAACGACGAVLAPLSKKLKSQVR